MGRLWLLTLALLTPFAAAQVLPDKADDAHLGVASCATSVCHGKVAPDPESTVWLNEYRIWQRQDFHSRAYKTLQTDQSRDIARKLGLPAAHTAKVCLDCHADNIAADTRGPKFQISDGVGCESCHGGAARWLESHAETGTSHADNVSKGMYPTEDPSARAKLCLSCHLGTEEKFATHDIMGAGHPRLVFELEIFTANQPAHYDVDADYTERKAAIDSTNMWLAGLIQGSRLPLELLQGTLFQNPGLMPELSFYQCHACHHPMDELRWQREGGNAALPPGAVRLNDGVLLMFIAVLEALEDPAAERLEEQLLVLHDASLDSRSAVATAAATLEATLENSWNSLVSRQFSSDTLRQLRSRLLTDAANGRFRHMTTAEQLFYAVETLTIELGEDERLQGQLDALFASVEYEADFVPIEFAARASRLREAL